MNVNNIITRKIFEGRYPYEMPYTHYMHLLETGFRLLEDKNTCIENCVDLSELKAIRIALEYRLEVIRQVRKKQINKALGSMHNLSAVA